MFGQYQRPLAFVMKSQSVRWPQGDAVVRDIQRLDYLSMGIRRTYSFCESPTGSRRIAAAR
ncbi:MAG: hypothetical protein A2V70_01325 [Planctomycetes bacterium RBG_13_63_9]|nr:MAG: hypothetical protein A2V70_01325 [Planctomycetes bacterium RBG_13_63_9]